MLSTPPRDHHVAAAVHDLIRGERDRLQTRRAKAVESDSADRCRQTGKKSGNSRDVVPLRAMGLTAAEYDVLDLGGIELRRLAQNILDAVRRQVVGTRQVERSAK